MCVKEATILQLVQSVPPLPSPTAPSGWRLACTSTRGHCGLRKSGHSSHGPSGGAADRTELSENGLLEGLSCTGLSVLTDVLPSAPRYHPLHHLCSGCGAQLGSSQGMEPRLAHPCINTLSYLSLTSASPSGLCLLLQKASLHCSLFLRHHFSPLPFLQSLLPSS